MSLIVLADGFNRIFYRISIVGSVVSRVTSKYVSMYHVYISYVSMYHMYVLYV